MFKNCCAVLAIIIFSSTLFAEETFIYVNQADKNPLLLSSKPLSANFTQDSAKLKIFNRENMYFLLRDAKTGETQALVLKKANVGSAIYSTVKSGTPLKQSINAEVYSLNNLKGFLTQRIKEAKKLIAKKQLSKQPIIVRHLDTEQILEIFDSKDDAYSTYNLTQDSQRAEIVDTLKPSPIPVEISERPVDVKEKLIDADLVESFLLQKDDSSPNQANESNWQAQAERKRRFQAKESARAWTPAIKKTNEEQAKTLVKEAFTQTQQKQYQQAEISFFEASNLAPQSELIYQHYGLALHRNGQYKKSNIILDLAQTTNTKKKINKYYQALNFYKLRDWKNAKSRFKKIMDGNDTKLSVKAAFYLGLIDQTLGHYDEARNYFQYVLDKSDDPAMDKKAEQYIEDGLRRKAQASKKTQRFFYNGVLGAFYDSNIVLAIDGQANQQTDQEGSRLLTSNKFKYRYFAGEANDLSLRAEATLMKSQKLNFDSSSSLEAADPWVFSVDAPWIHRGMLWGRGYTFEISPKYEIISMDLDNTVRKDIIHSAVLNFNNKLIMNKRWIAVGNYEFRKDDANANTRTITDAADALKFSADWSAIIILDKEKERYLIPQLGLSLNDAQGNDFAYNRWDAGLVYTSAIWGSLVWTSKVGFYQSDYKSNRLDNNLNAGTGLGYALGTQTNLGFNFGYQKNNSNTNKYEKYQVITTLGFGF